MNKKIDIDEVIDSIDMFDGSRIVLLDRAGRKDIYSKEERARNIFFLDQKGRVAWQIRTRFDADGGPFTRISRQNGTLHAYRWDGGLYEVDVGTGNATPLSLEK